MILISLLLTCANASDFPRNFSNTSQKTGVQHDFSHLSSNEAVHQQAAEITKSFITSLEQLARKSNNCQECTNEKLIVAVRYTKRVQNYLTHDSILRQKMDDLYNSLMVGIKERDKLIEDINFENTKDEGSTCILHSTQAINEIIQALQSVSLDELSFERLVDFSELVTKFSICLNAFEEDEETIAFKKTMRALKIRKVELNMNPSDLENVRQTYASYSKRLLEVFKDIDLVAEGTPYDKVSSVVLKLASVVAEFADLSSDRDSLSTRIGVIVEEERETTKTLNSSKEKISNQECSQDYLFDF